MDWEEAHARRVATFPEDIRAAHGRATNHRDEIEASAICPRCGIDSVIGDAAGYPLTTEFLSRMKAYWFGEEPR